MNSKNSCGSCTYYASDIYWNCVIGECIHEDHHHIVVPEDEVKGCSDWKRAIGKSIYECMKPEAVETLIEVTTKAGIETMGDEVMNDLDKSIGIRETIINLLKRHDIGSAEHSYIGFEKEWFEEKFRW